ncbi:MAG: L,D-transpeptidase family protein, partial [Cetobacterium sp.]
MKKSKLISLGIMVFGLTFLSQPLHAASKTVKEKYENVIPMSVYVNIMNNEAEPEYLNYAFIKSVEAPIRQDSSIYSKEIVRFPFNTKVKVIEKVESNGNEWYKVELKDKNGNKVNGYISALLVTLRRFRFEEMNNRVHKLSQFLNTELERGKELVSINTYVPNPSNQNMSRIKDKYGVSADQNAKATYNGETIFIPDRSLMSIESSSGNDVYVNALSIPEKSLKVNKSAISRYPAVSANFRKVIAIDLENENQGIFQKNSDGRWELISYTLNKTGMESTLGFETPKGYFIVPALKYEMGYRDEYNNAAGIAKYAIRFSGGGYIHGTPINYEENINRDFFL